MNRKFYLWVDEYDNPPNMEYIWIKTANNFKKWIKAVTALPGNGPIELYIDMNNNAGHAATDGGNYVEILKWLELHKDLQKKFIFNFNVHETNPDGKKIMIEIIHANNWNIFAA